MTLQLIRNPGAAFSMGENFTVVLTIIAIAALVAVLALHRAPRPARRLGRRRSGLLLAGIAGNLDRPAVP